MPDVCSICAQDHNFKSCSSDKSHPVCANCKGDHIAFSASCPIKKTKIEENKVKARATKYADLFNEKSFPQLNARSVDTHVQNLLKSESFLSMLTQVIIKLVSNKDVPINTSSIRDTFIDTISKRAHSSK